MKNNIALVIFLLSQLAPAFAAPPYQRPAGIADDKEPLIVAGYRALFTCSAHFFAGRPLDDIKKVELVNSARYPATIRGSLSSAMPAGRW